MLSGAPGSFLASIEPLYKDYVLQRRADRKSYRDMGTFREWACEQLHAADFDVKVCSGVVDVFRAWVCCGGRG